MLDSFLVIEWLDNYVELEDYLKEKLEIEYDIFLSMLYSFLRAYVIAAKGDIKKLAQLTCSLKDYSYRYLLEAEVIETYELLSDLIIRAEEITKRRR